MVCTENMFREHVPARTVHTENMCEHPEILLIHKNMTEIQRRYKLFSVSLTLIPCSNTISAWVWLMFTLYTNYILATQSSNLSCMQGEIFTIKLNIVISLICYPNSCTFPVLIYDLNGSFVVVLNLKSSLKLPGRDGSWMEDYATCGSCHLAHAAVFALAPRLFQCYDRQASRTN